MSGLLKKFGSYAILCRVAVYLDLLEAVTPSSKVFEGRELMIYEVKPSIKKTQAELEEYATYESIEEDITTNLHRYVIQRSPDGENVLEPIFKAPGDARRHVDNR